MKISDQTYIVVVCLPKGGPMPGQSAVQRMEAGVRQAARTGPDKMVPIITQPLSPSLQCPEASFIYHLREIVVNLNDVL
jgi:hypothetical protein